MDITLKEIPIKDLVDGYKDIGEEGVFGLGGKLDIRPAYQREFTYEGKQRESVIKTVRAGLPLNTMYWAVREDGTFEVLDGQQRTISICQYVSGIKEGVGSFPVQDAGNTRYFHNLTPEERGRILNYKLMIYYCTGTVEEKLEWFRTINIAGAKFTEQELRNSVYTGTWLADAKKYFSKTNCPAYNIAKDYVKGSPIRQDYLETVLDWVSEGHIEEYMATNQHESSAHELWIYFQNVISWVKAVFPNYREEMKGLPWGFLYNDFKEKKLDPVNLEAKIKTLMQDEDVTKKSGIYLYVLTGEEKYLNIRAFSANQKREVYDKQGGVCPKCGDHFEIEEMEADHITPWHEGGKTISENCQMLCKKDNRMKSGK